MAYRLKTSVPKIIISQDSDSSITRTRGVSFAKNEGKDGDLDDIFNANRRNTGYESCQPGDDDDESLLSLPAELPPPPDGGWGWVIVFASFLCNMIVDGICYSFSPFLEAFAIYFHESRGKLAWISSLLAGFYLMVGPLVSALLNKYGCRVVCRIGGLVAGIAFAVTIFANSVPFLMVTQGIIAGLGFGLMYLPAVVMVSYYFESKRALATGIAVCGSGVGTIALPPLMHLLIDKYGWKGTNLIVAGIILNGCWIGGLMRPLKVTKMTKKELLNRLSEEKKAYLASGSMYGSDNSNNRITRNNPNKSQIKTSNRDPGVHSHANLSGYFTPTGTYSALPTIQETSQPKNEVDFINSANGDGPVIKSGGKYFGNTGRKFSDSVVMKDIRGGPVPEIYNVYSERRLSKYDILNQLKVVPATPEASYTNLRGLHSEGRRSSAHGRVFSMGSFQDQESGSVFLRRNSSKDRRDIMLRPMSRQDIFYSGSIRNLNEFKSQSSMLSYRESTLNIQGTGASKVVLNAMDGIDSTDGGKGEVCSDDTICETLTQMMDFSIMKNPVFLIIGVANFIGMLGFYTPFVYLPAAAIEKNVNSDSATFLVSIIGITNTVGRILAGLIADIPGVNALVVNNICLILAGICVLITPFATSYTAFVCIAVFFGFFVAGYVSLTSIILVDLMGLPNLTNAFGCLILFRGSASLLGPPMAGSIYDASKSYDVSFFASGGLLLLCAILHCCIPCVQRWCNCHQEPVRYTTNEEYLQTIPEEERSKHRGNISPDVTEGAGIVLEIKPKLEKSTTEPKEISEI